MISLKTVLEIGRVLGIGGTITALVKFVYGGGRRAFLMKCVDTLSTQTVYELAAGDLLLADALREERKALLFESISGIAANGKYREMLIRFVNCHNGRYAYSDLRNLRGIGRWNGATFVSHAKRADRVVNIVYSWFSFVLMPVGVLLVGADLVLHAPDTLVLSSLLIAGTGAGMIAFFAKESREQHLGMALETFSSCPSIERMDSGIGAETSSALASEPRD